MGPTANPHPMMRHAATVVAFTSHATAEILNATGGEQTPREISSQYAKENRPSDNQTPRRGGGGAAPFQ